MNLKTMTLASIYELQGFKDEALEIYKDVLKTEPHNQEAQKNYKRLSNEYKNLDNINTKAKDFFIQMSSQEDIKKFERWLTKWS